MDSFPESLQETICALHAVIGPLQRHLGRRRGHHEQSHGIGAVFLDEFLRVNRIALGLGHLRAILQHHALREEIREWLVGCRYKFNTAVAAAMELLNAIKRFDDSSAAGRAVVQEALDAIVLVLSPTVPHVCHELWHALGHESAPVNEAWPAFDATALDQDMVEIVVQVNGKLRGRISVAVDADSDSISETALADENVKRFVADKTIRKTIVVPGRLVNVVV